LRKGEIKRGILKKEGINLALQMIEIPLCPPLKKGEKKSPLSPLSERGE
jgi:hypothetical protein